MNNDEKLIELSLISKSLGRNVLYVQGGGGNTSVKLDKTRMAIKASGYFLSDVTPTDGYSIVDYNKIQCYLETPDIDEDIFTKRIKSHVVETTRRPSIETGFHAILNTYVIHTHSVFANLLTCSKEGKGISKSLFPDSLWINYESPGRELTLAIKMAISRKRTLPDIIFLENHGVIVSSTSKSGVELLHDQINSSIQNHFKICDDDIKEIPATLDIEYIKEHILFPDQVVYTLAGKEILETKAAKETLLAYSYISSLILRLSLTPNYLSKEDADFLLNMESEKFRQQVTK